VDALELPDILVFIWKYNKIYKIKTNNPIAALPPIAPSVINKYF
jgi:hypothetical protein